jgi:hypothetical protein
VVAIDAVIVVVNVDIAVAATHNYGWEKKPNQTAKLNRNEPKKLNHNQKFETNLKHSGFWSMINTSV